MYTQRHMERHPPAMGHNNYSYTESCQHCNKMADSANVSAIMSEGIDSHSRATYQLKRDMISKVLVKHA